MMRAVYGFSAQECDDMYAAEFKGYTQHLTLNSEIMAQHIALKTAQMLGLVKATGV